MFTLGDYLKNFYNSNIKLIKSINNIVRTIIMLNNLSKSVDRSHVSKLFINNLMQYMNVCCRYVHQTDPSKGFLMDGCYSVYRINPLIE